MAATGPLDWLWRLPPPLRVAVTHPSGGIYIACEHHCLASPCMTLGARSSVAEVGASLDITSNPLPTEPMRLWQEEASQEAGYRLSIALT